LTLTKFNMHPRIGKEGVICIGGGGYFGIA
jgi:hypothetical protein